MSPFKVSYITLMDDDIWSLSAFYERLFDIQEIPLKTEIYRGLDLHGVTLSFSSPEAYELCGLAAPTTEKTIHEFITFTTPHYEQVASYTEKAVALGGSVAKAPHMTYYGAWLSVLIDPSGNVFRLCHAPEHD